MAIKVPRQRLFLLLLAVSVVSLMAYFSGTETYSSVVLFLEDHVVSAAVIVSSFGQQGPNYRYYFEKTEETFKIPKVCYQTWSTKNIDDLTPTTRRLLLKNKHLNPDIDWQLWDDDDIDVFIKKEFPDHVYTAFKSLNPKVGPAKADFFRYCILYIRGGIYLDIKSSMKFSNIFGKIIRPDDEAILDVRRLDKEKFRSVWGYGTYEQWFLIFAPNHPYLKYMIDRMVRSITSKVEIVATRFKDKILRLTGPDALAAAIHDAVVDVGVHHREVNYKLWLRYKSMGVGNPEYLHLKRNHYSSLRLNESMFLDSNGVAQSSLSQSRHRSIRQRV